MNKGITPAIATVLLVAITIGAAGTLYTIVSSTQETANNQVSNVELPVGDISRESCWVAGERANAQFRNNGRDSINTSYIAPLIDGRIAENYTITPNGIVEPQGTFRIGFNQSVYSSSPIRLARGETDRTYFCRQFPTDGPKLEVGKTEVSASINNGANKTVDFENFYYEPVGAVFVSSGNTDANIDARIMDLNRNNMTVFFENATGTGIASPENISYMVAKEGSYQINGVKIEAGKTTLQDEPDFVHLYTEDFVGKNVFFEESFDSKPAIFHSLNTYNNGDFMTTSVSKPDQTLPCDTISCQPDSTGLGIEQEAGDTIGTPSAASEETAGWIAVENGTNIDLSPKSEVGLSEDGDQDGFDLNAFTSRHQIQYKENYNKKPITLANGYSGHGNHGYWARTEGINNASRIDLYASETTDDNTHNNEYFSYIAFEEEWSYPN